MTCDCTDPWATHHAWHWKTNGGDGLHVIEPECVCGETHRRGAAPITP